MRPILSFLFFAALALGADGQDYPGIPTEPEPGDLMLVEYLAAETAKLTAECLAEIETAEDWEKSRPRYREQLFEMLGMQKRRERTPLAAGVTGSQKYDGIVVENVVFQSSPGLYVTANFYYPDVAESKPLPSILYVCGHSTQKALGISYGNKTGYHHHGVWFAKHGYTCLMIDTVQLGEIEGIHHGTYREGRWWWNSRGYSSAAVEAWNGIRALDYMESRAEVDSARIGITGRSGGGAYSWWVAALDERVKVAVPVAGITNLENHVVEGVVEGHCDCMFHVNTYRWDFPAIAALVAPRPLLIANTDKDTIFPLDGVVDVYTKTRRIYKLLGAEANIGLAISEGPHKDTQPLRAQAFHWFERHLKGRDATDEIDTSAPKVLDRSSLRVLREIPGDEIVTTIDEHFVEKAAPFRLPADQAAWEVMRDGWMEGLREKCFRGWPDEAGELRIEKVAEGGVKGMRVIHFEFESQAPFRLPLVVAIPEGTEKLRLMVADEAEFQAMSAGDFSKLKQLAAKDREAVAILAARGIGPTAWTSDARERVHIRRRFMLLGQTLDGMRVWDIRRALTALRSVEEVEGLPITISAGAAMAENALLASLFEPPVAALDLTMPETRAIYLNIDRVLDLTSATAMAVERSRVTIRRNGETEWRKIGVLEERLGWKRRSSFLSESHSAE